ncbi:cyanophycinase [Vogesella sp. EB]|nr:cyanophycinase [Vogesella sp. EB]
MMKQHTIKMGGLLAALALAWPLAPAQAEGHLLAVGGMLRASNQPVYQKFIELAGGVSNARIAIMPTASGSQSSSKRFRGELIALGVPEANISIINIDRKNYQDTMNDPDTVKPLTLASAVWFVGGDQARIARALYNGDGSPSLAFQAIRAVKERGGVVGGSSAGASIQGVWMPTAYGVVMDTLDFGVAARGNMRGTAVLKGSGLFDGVIDQHLDKLEETTSGRALRMASYLTSRNLKRGYGLDTNTAMWVKPDGSVEVLGEGYVTVMDVSSASNRFGIYGSEIRNVRLAMLGSGDRYDPARDVIVPDPGKVAIKAGDEYLNGNALIPDLSAVNSVGRAVIYGLADNKAGRQQGLLTRYNPANGYHYGYRVNFSKGESFAAWSRFVDSLTNYTVRDVRMDIEPVDAMLGHPARTRPADIARSKQQQAIAAVVFRGLMTTDAQRRFEPQRAITRAELANALQMTLNGELKAAEKPLLSDVAGDHPLREQIEIVVSNGWMSGYDRFWPQQAVTREEFALAVRRLTEVFQQRSLAQRATLLDAAQLGKGYDEAAALVVGEGLLAAPGGRFNGKAPVMREEVARVLAQVTGIAS